MPSDEPNRVEPGELITAEFMNSLLARIEDIESTLEQLEVPEKDLTITSLQPSGRVRVGDALTVLGQGFRPLSETVATVGPKRIETFAADSNDSRLIFDVPPIENLPDGDGGARLKLTVSGKHGFDEQFVTILPFQPLVPEGQIFIRLEEGPDTDTIEPGNTYTFTLAVEVISNLQESFTLTAGIDAESRPENWSARPVDEGGDTISTISFPKSGPPGTKQLIPVEVDVPSGTERTTARLTFAITSRRNPQNFAETFESSEIEVGAAPPDSEAISIQRSSIVQGAEVASDGKTLIVTDAAIVGYSASVPENGVAYDVTLANIPGGWDPHFEGGETSVTASGTQGQIVFEVRIPRPQSGTADGTFDIRVEKQDDASVFGTFRQPLRRE